MRLMKLGSACVRALLQRKRCVRRRLAKVCCYESMPAARCYSGSRDQGKIDQKREYISVNGEATFSSLQTLW